MHCARCGSPDTEAQFDTIFCFACGATSDSHGNVMPDKPQWLVPATAGAGAGS